MKFRNLDELTKHYQKKLDTGDVKEFKELQNKDVIVGKKELENAAKALKNYLHKQIEQYFNSYNPNTYQRTGQFIDSLDVEVTNTGGKLSARVFFDNSKVIRDSLWEGQSQAYLPKLLDSGWKTSRGWHKNIPHFGYYEGIGFMDAAVEAARSDVRFKGLDIEVHKDSPI